MNINCVGAYGNTLNNYACGPERVMSVVLMLPSYNLIDLNKCILFYLQLDNILLCIYIILSFFIHIIKNK